MKINISLITFLLTVIFANGQKSPMYIGTGVSFAFEESASFHLSTSFINKKNLVFDLNFGAVRFGVDLPSNYSPSFEHLFTKPKDLLNSIGFSMGKKIQFKNSKAAFIPKAGFSYFSYSPVEFESYYSDFSGFGNQGDTYQRAVHNNSVKGVGLDLALEILIPFKQKVGMKFLLNGNLNRERSYLLLGSSLIVGKLFNKK